jgi:O-methyltransferase involved in polyketide biosynthesis
MRMAETEHIEHVEDTGAGEAVLLDGVPETMLWTLHYRAAEARRPDTVLHDPQAVTLVEAVDFPFLSRFGHPGAFLAQAFALRAAAFDSAVRQFLDVHPAGTVVALGEGLETAFWRVDNGTVQWLTVDLPQPLALRTALLPHGPRQRTLACDARDPAWTAEVDPAQGVLVLAQGLLMYLRPPEVRDLLALCAESFPGGSLVFDAMPRLPGPARHANRSLRVSSSYSLPPMPWRMDADDRPALYTAHPGIVEVTDVPLPPGRGPVWGWLAPWVDRIPVARNKRSSVTLLRFAGRGSADA